MLSINVPGRVGVLTPGDSEIPSDGKTTVGRGLLAPLLEGTEPPELSGGRELLDPAGKLVGKIPGSNVGVESGRLPVGREGNKLGTTRPGGVVLVSKFNQQT